MLVMIMHVVLLTSIFFIFFRYDLRLSPRKSLTRSIFVTVIIVSVYVIFQQPLVEGNRNAFSGGKSDTFGPKTRGGGNNTFGTGTKGGIDMNTYLKTITEKSYRTTLPIDKRWQDDNNLFS